MAPRVSVLMAVYNGEEFLRRSVESVLSQEIDDLELVIGDNASTDATPEVIRGYAAVDRRVKYFRNPTNLGATANWNLCYRNSDQSSDFWAFLACDDWWEPTFLSTMVEAARSCPSATFIHCDMYRTHPDGRHINRYSDLFPSFTSVGEHRALREMFRGCYVNIMAAIVDRQKQQALLPVQDILAPDLTFTPDYNLWLQLLSRGASGFYVPRPLAYYRKHDGAMTMPVNVIPRLREEVVIFRDKLTGVCPGDLETERRRALEVRLARLGFELLRDALADEARYPLRDAMKLRSGLRVDVPVASAISSLPISATHRASLWRMALATSRVLSRS